MSEITAERSVTLREALSRVEVDALGVASVADMAPAWLRDQVLALLPEARSVVALGMESYVEMLDHAAPNKMIGEAVPGDLFKAHQEYVNSRGTRAAYAVGKLCHTHGFRALPMCAGMGVDFVHLKALLSFKHVAQAAGLGVIGWNSLLLSPQFGPRLRLACVLTDAELKPTPRMVEEVCTGCNVCLDACPVQALSQPAGGDQYAIDKAKCRVFRVGTNCCVECMRVCPIGR